MTDSKDQLRIFLCGMIRGEEETIKRTILPFAQYFDGLSFVVDDKAPETSINLLNNAKGQGNIITQKWVNDHAWTSNLVLFYGKMEFSDYFVWIDETDELNPVFLKRLREDIFYWKKNNVGMVYIDHPFIVQYHDGLRFQASPHWSLSSPLGRTIDLKSISGYRKENFVFNTRDLLKSGFLNPAKYWYCYPAFSNHTQLLYAHFGSEIWQQHEHLRIQFRYFCREQLKLEWTLESLINYLKTNIGNYPPFLEQALEIEPNLKDIFRLYALNQPLEKLIANRFDWSYFIWKEKGLLDQNPAETYFIGQYNKYNLNIDRPRE